MSTVLCTMPGKFGDSLWALPTAKAIAKAYTAPVDWLMSPGFSAHLPLIAEQPYIAEARVCPAWEVQNTAPMTPFMPPTESKFIAYTTHRGKPEGLEFGIPTDLGYYKHIYHLGYQRWPAELLPLEIAHTVNPNWTAEELMGSPWITVPADPRRPIVVGFTDEYAELKAGLIGALAQAFPHQVLVLGPEGSRLQREWSWSSAAYYPADWQEAARLITGAKVFVGCLSALAVLAAATGTKRVLVEPNPQRHHKIFQHWDQALLAGGDGLPTFHAPHMIDAVKEALDA